MMSLELTAWRSSSLRLGVILRRDWNTEHTGNKIRRQRDQQPQQLPAMTSQAPAAPQKKKKKSPNSTPLQATPPCTQDSPPSSVQPLCYVLGFPDPILLRQLHSHFSPTSSPGLPLSLVLASLRAQGLNFFTPELALQQKERKGGTATGQLGGWGQGGGGGGRGQGEGALKLGAINERQGHYKVTVQYSTVLYNFTVQLTCSLACLDCHDGTCPAQGRRTCTE